MITPSNTASAGPVIKTDPVRPGQEIKRGPPGSMTSACSSARSRSTAATSVAQAPVPQARVGPAPRSQTRISNRSREWTLRKCTFVLAGNTGCTSKAAPHSSKGIRLRSSTGTTTWGLPIPTEATLRGTPSISNDPRGKPASDSSVVGIEVGSKKGAPISTCNCPSDINSGRIIPAGVSIAHRHPGASPSVSAR